jgi:hypothetical protein
MVDARYEQVRVDNLVRDCAVLIALGDIGLSILLKMELIALPGNAWHDGFSSGFNATVSITDDEFSAKPCILA